MKKIHRFIGNYQLGQGTIRIDDPALADQMRSVLKLAVGETVIMGDGTGLEAQCRILSYERGAVLLDGLSLGQNPNELRLQTTLYLAVLKADHFEMAAARASEVGVSRIVPIVTGRTVKTGLRVSRVQSIVRESAELSGRGLVPTVGEVTDLKNIWTDASKNDVNYFFDPSGKEFVTGTKSHRTAGVFIGPEGGWDDSEVEMADHMGLAVTTLGGLVMRADTAATVACYLVAHSVKM